MSPQHYLVIVESPSKCEKIKSFLTSTEKYKNTIVVATCGHFRELKSICPETFDMKFDIMSKSKKYITQIKKLASRKNTKVILATDWDREGEAIAYHICESLKLPITKTERIRFGEITKNVILEAMENPFVIDKNLVYAQMTRQIIDRWIGFHFSPLLWKQFPKHRGLSAGRCQTPTLKLIYNQEQKIKEAVPETNFQVLATFQEECFSLNHRFDSESSVKNFLQNEISFPHKIVSVKNKKAYEYPGLPFSTSALQKYCNHCFGWSPSVTMVKAQQLYEQGFITYHRTESQQISEHFKSEMSFYIQTKYGEEYCDPSKIKSPSAKSKNLPHEAIRITSVEKVLENNPLYDAIRKRSLQSIMSKAVFNEQTIHISSSSSSYLYEKKYKDVDFKGFLIIAESKSEKEERKKWVPQKTIQYDTLETKEMLVDKIKYYSEGNVISNLEQMGIGRPSTFASFVSKVQEKNYVEKLSKNISSGIFLKCIVYDKKKGNFIKMEQEYIQEEKSKLFITDLGLKVVEFLYEKFPTFFEFEFTSSLESNLDDIATGKLKYKSLLKDMQKQLQTKQ